MFYSVLSCGQRDCTLPCVNRCRRDGVLLEVARPQPEIQVSMDSMDEILLMLFFPPL